jgi:hypothetical protein
MKSPTFLQTWGRLLRKIYPNSVAREIGLIRGTAPYLEADIICFGEHTKERLEIQKVTEYAMKLKEQQQKEFFRRILHEEGFLDKFLKQQPL